MEIGQSIWRLKGKCQCFGCTGMGGELEFITCPNCGKVMLECNEVGTIFPDPRNTNPNDPQNKKWIHSEDEADTICPKCKKIKIVDFRYSTSDEIKALGFTPDQYQ